MHADGTFGLYEDDGLSYGYEKGAFSRIPLHWSDRERRLTIGARAGSYPGMLSSRVFEIVLVTKTRPVGFSFTPTPDRTVTYSGETLTIPLE